MTNHWSDLRNADAFMVCGCNCAENHPISWKWIQDARDKRGAKLVVVDPRFTRSAAKADAFSFIRPGTDIAFFGGLINYAIQNNYIQWEYVQNYTNGPLLVVDGFSFDSATGLFSGRQDGKTMGAAYDKSTWMVQYKDQAAKTGALRMPLIDVDDMTNFRGKPTGMENGDPSTCKVNREHPLYSQSAFAKLEEHYSRYTPAMVEKVCGIPQAKFKELAEAYVKQTYMPGKSGNLMYAMGLTQSTVGVEKIRTFAVLQLLLGNTGLPGGGINALRGESNVQGSTDAALLYHIIPGYMPCPTSKEKDLDTYNAASSPGEDRRLLGQPAQVPGQHAEVLVARRGRGKGPGGRLRPACPSATGPRTTPTSPSSRTCTRASSRAASAGGRTRRWAGPTPTWSAPPWTSWTGWWPSTSGTPR